MININSISAISLSRFAFFFDLDGTLASIAPRPEQVALPVERLRAIEHLIMSNPAVAIVSGRSLSDIDRILAPLRCMAAGLHGAEIRLGDEAEYGAVTPLPAIVRRRLEDALGPLADRIIEDKGGAIALHYREYPHLAGRLEALARSVCDQCPELVVMPGKCVFEFKPRHIDKGKAIERFMSREPFRGRIPVFLGDDVTDEAGFEAVNRLHGISVKVGAGPSVAVQRLSSVTEVHRWLSGITEHQCMELVER